MKIAPGLASLKLSMSTSTPRNRRTGTKARTALAAICLPENLQGHHRLAARGGPAFVGDGTADRQGEVQRRQHVQPEIELAADVAHGAADTACIEIRDQAARKQCRPHPGQVQARRTRAPEIYGREIPFHTRLDEVATAYLVQLGAGQRVVFAISLFLLVVDEVVAEAAEIEVGKRLARALWR